MSLKEYLAVAKTQGSAATVNYIDRKASATTLNVPAIETATILNKASFVCRAATRMLCLFVVRLLDHCQYALLQELLDFLTTAGASSPYVKPSELEAHLATTTLVIAPARLTCATCALRLRMTVVAQAIHDLASALGLDKYCLYGI